MTSKPHLRTTIEALIPPFFQKYMYAGLALLVDSATSISSINSLSLSLLISIYMTCM